MRVIRVRGMRVFPLLSIALMAMHVVLAQPPVGPDPEPKTTVAQNGTTVPQTMCLTVHN